MIKKIFSSLSAVILCWIIGFFWFVSNVPSSPTTDLRRTDAVVVLTGGSERLKAGLSLLTNGYGDDLFISGVGKGVTINDLFATENLPPEKIEMLKQRVHLGYAAEDTHENGVEVARWVAGKNFQTIRLVTSNYHIPRSMIEISSKLSNIEILPFPVFPHRVKVSNWWKYPGTRELLFKEYIKYLGAIVRVQFYE